MNPSHSGFLITPDGRRLGGDNGEFLELLGEPDPELDSRLFDILDQGFIYWRTSGALVDILVQAANVGRAAIDTALLLIDASDAKLFTINHLSQLGWRQESLVDTQTTCARLLELCDRRDQRPETT